MCKTTPLTIKETITYILENSPQNLRGLRKNLNTVFKKNGLSEIKQDSFFEIVVSTWGDYLESNKNPLSFSECRPLKLGINMWVFVA
jgi:hypothetical protein